MTEEKDRQAWFALAVLFAINTMNFFDRQILAAVTEPIRKQWMLSDTAMGLMNTVFVLVYAAIGVPLGRWADRGKRTRILSICVSIWSVFTAASGLAWSYWSLFVARMGVGIGEAGCSPAGNSLIGDLYPASKRARATGIFMLGLPIGIFLSNLLSGLIAERFAPIVGANNSWKAPFWIATIPGLLLALLALRITEPVRGASEAYDVAGQAQEGSPYRRVLSIPTMWWIILSGALHNFNAYAVNAFLPAYLGRYHGLGLQRANTIAAFTLGAVGVVGLLGGGFLADWARRKSPSGRMILGSCALFALTPLTYLALNLPKGEIPTFMVLMGTGWMLFYIYYVTVYPTVQDVVEPALRGTAMALYFFAMYVLGGAFGTTILGMLSDHFAKKAMFAAGAGIVTEQFKAIGLHDAFFIVPVVSLLLALVLFAGSRTVARDMERLQQWMRKASGS
ncbi:MAG: MFS transporter [Blastocatellia bacterium]|nr:MFS transporter [Blastocatellia bacterium]